MVLPFPIRRSSVRSGQIQKSVPKKPVPKPVVKTGLFGEKKYLSSLELRQALRKASPKIPGYGRMFTKIERLGLEKVFKKYGSYGISKGKYKLALGDLQRQKMYERNYAKKKELDQQIKFLKAQLK